MGFHWAAGVAAALLEGRQVALVPPPGARIPGTDERVRILDAVCSLLPYGCRAWLSAATWTGQSEHKLMLVFAPTARTEQLATWLGGGSPPEPRSAVARDYLNELLRIRAKRGSTDELVAHLLKVTEAIPAQEPAAALRALREADLVDSVVADIAQGRGDLLEVLRVLQLHPAGTLGEHRMALIVPFLAGYDAREALLRCWSARTPRLLADDVLASPATKETFTRATGYLRVLDGLEAEHPGSFEELFTIMAGAPNQEPGWVAALIHFTANEFRYVVDAVDRVVIGSREVGRAWLRKLVMDHSRKPLPPLTRLVPLALRAAGIHDLPGWLRFAGLLTGHLRENQVQPSDAAEFADAGDDAWAVALDIAADNDLPVVVSLMWSCLRVPASSSPRRLLEALDAAVVPGGSRLTPEAAADADLLGVLARAAAQGHLGPLSMPRLGRFADPGDQDAYAATLFRRIDTDPDLKKPAIEALLGETPDDAAWRVVLCLIRRLPSAEEYVLNAVEHRLSRSHGSGEWIDVLSEDQVRTLSRRQLTWLPRVWELRSAVRAGEPLGELGRITAEAHVDKSMSARYLDELIGCLCTWGPVATYDLATDLDGRVSGLGISLYKALRGSERARELCEELKRFSYGELERHRQILLAMGAASGGTAPPPPPPPAPVPSPSWVQHDHGPRPAPQDDKRGRLQRWMPGWRP